MSTYVFFDGCKTPQEHMERDSRLLEEGNSLALRFYTWPEPSCTWGVCVDPEALLQKEALLSIPHARRPTGGGLLFHGHDLAFSLFLPSDHKNLFEKSEENYRQINQCVLKALLPLLGMTEDRQDHEVCVRSSPTHFCQAKTTQYDLVLGSKKIGGCAERRTKKGLLHQTSLFVREPNWALLTRLVKDPLVIEEMKQTTASLLELAKEPEQVSMQSLQHTLFQALGLLL